MIWDVYPVYRISDPDFSIPDPQPESENVNE